VKEIKGRGCVKKGAKYGKKITIFSSYKEYMHKNKISQSQYSNVIKEFAKELMKSLLDGNIVKFPLMLGQMYIVRRKLKDDDKVVNWNASVENKEVIPHVNLHSDGYVARLHWSKSLAHFTNQSFWKFDLTKDNKSRNEISLCKHIKKFGTSNFYEKI
jgi:hypothetical protein